MYVVGDVVVVLGDLVVFEVVVVYLWYVVDVV